MAGVQRLLDVVPLLKFYPCVHVIRHSPVAYITMDTVNRLFPVRVLKKRQASVIFIKHVFLDAAMHDPLFFG